MCGVVSGKLKEQYPNFGPREWLIFLGVVLAILAGNVVNLIFNIYKYQSAARNPVTSISQENIASDFPSFTLAMCLEYDLQGIANSANTTIHATDIQGGSDLKVNYALISNEVTYLDCWLIDFPAINLKVPKKLVNGTTNPNARPTWDGYKIEGFPQPWDEALRKDIAKSRMKGIFRAYPPGITAMPADFDEFDYDNVFQLLTPGYEGSIPVSYKESFFYGQSQDKPAISFPLSQFRTLSDVVYENYSISWSLQVDAKGLNKQKTVTREDSTFGVAALFAALLSIFNISLTIFALFFPTQPLVVAQTYFRFNSPPKFDPTKLDAKSQAELMSSPKSTSRANSRAGSRPASPGPGDEISDFPVKEEGVALTSVPDKRERAETGGGNTGENTGGGD